MAELWTPTLEQVADHIPTRTRNAASPGDTALSGTFSAQTEPTDEQARRHIAAAVAEVLGAVGGAVPTAPTFLYHLASEAAALRAAADIELAYPNRNADADRFPQLDQRAKDALDRLKQAMDDQGSGTEGSLLPQWAFPEPAWYGDYPL
ncbi:hypothetical protein MF672_038780 [Actinomadura sp. ATCC 31491]|uniref:Uncharacterized protein n=1 Tax=Actinomadura luzonensis TaxID=2805427 RepID=A0ABT0G551_9ACTN|nr:hypothetical protein [Actinomadura luzonensis]MCK2219700.1 hypothetical protein [Actinomadura luzonensis]